MDRRDFLKVGSAALVGLGAEGCATAPVKEAAALPPLDAEAVERVVERIDRRMQAILDEEPLVKGARAPRSEAEAELVASRLELFRQASRTFYLGGIFLELSEAERCHPGVQDRVRRLLPEMDAATKGVRDLLSSLKPEELRALQQVLRDDPDIGAQLGELVTAAAKEDGFSFQRRVDLRLSMDDLARRLRAQNPSLVIDPVLRKVQRLEVEVRDSSVAERQARAKLGEEAFWGMRERTAAISREWARIYETRPRTDLARLERTYPLPGAGGDPVFDPEGVESATGVLRLGAWTFGIGAGVELAGGIFALANLEVPAIVLGVTVGPILMSLGLLILLVGGIYYFAVAP